MAWHGQEGGWVNWTALSRLTALAAVYHEAISLIYENGNSNVKHLLQARLLLRAS